MLSFFFIDKRQKNRHDSQINNFVDESPTVWTETGAES